MFMVMLLLQRNSRWLSTVSTHIDQKKFMTKYIVSVCSFHVRLTGPLGRTIFKLA